MAHHANSLVLILIVCMHTLHAMKKPDPPEDTPLSEHLKDFKAGKKKKSNPERPRTPAAEEEAPLIEHLRRFEQGKTVKKIDQAQIPPAQKTPLEAHQENFGCHGLPPKLKLLHKLPPLVKTAAQIKLERQALRTAVGCNDLHTVEKLLFEGVEPMARNNTNQETTLHLAARLGHEPLVELLLDHPLMNREAINDHQIPAIVHAIENGLHYCVGSFLERRVWIGPDTEKFTCLHTAVQCNKILSILAFLTYCIDPESEIPDPFLVPIPPDQNDNNSNELLAPQQELGQQGNHLPEIIARPFNPLDLDTIDRHTAQQSMVMPLESLCLQKLLFTHIDASVALRCDILAKLWKGHLQYKIPASLTRQLGFYMDFAAAREFVLSFAPKDHYVIAKELAHYYAAKHLKSITRLLNSANVHHETPLQMAIRLQRDPLMQAFVDPVRYISYLTRMLTFIPELKFHLAKHPNEQNAYDLFYYLFVYRLTGHQLLFNRDLK